MHSLINKIQSKIKSNILLDYDMRKSTWFRAGGNALGFVVVQLFCMYLSRAVGIDLKGEKLLGLVDGAQAIVLTLLVIELPALIIVAIEHAGDTSTLAFDLATDLVGYLVAALIIFDIWSLQKAMIDSTKPSSIQSLTCIVTLWLSSLVPVFFFLTEKFAQDGFAEAHSFDAISNLPEILVFRSILLFVIGSIYFVIYLYIARHADFINPVEARYVRELARNRSTYLAVILAINVPLSLKFGVTFTLLPLVAFVPILFLTPKVSRLTEF